MRHPDGVETDGARLAGRRHIASGAALRHSGDVLTYPDSRTTLAAAVLAGLLCAACAERAPAPDASVVWIVLDAATARASSLYGNERATTPELARLAARATVFERAYAQAPATFPSAVSYLTGYYPPRGDRNVRAQLRSPVAVLLRQAGLRTAAFSESPYVNRGYGFGEGFETFEAYLPFQTFRQSPHGFERSDSERTTRDAITWLDAHADERVFLYVHFLLPHAPYDAPEPFRGRFAEPRRGRIRTMRHLVAVDLGN